MVSWCCSVDNSPNHSDLWITPPAAQERRKGVKVGPTYLPKGTGLSGDDSGPTRGYLRAIPRAEESKPESDA